MAVSWGNWERNTRLGVDIRPDAGYWHDHEVGYWVDFWFQANVSVTDAANVLNWSGQASGTKNPGMNQSGTGAKLIHTIWIARTRLYGTPQQTTINTWLTGLEWVPDGRLDASATVTTPARPHEIPNPPPTVGVLRTSDTQHTVSWTTDYTSVTGPRPWAGVHVERWDNLTNGWYRVATLPWSTTAWTDTSTAPDRLYRWRVQSYNGTGASDYTSPTPVDHYTTPAAHTHLVWAKVGVDVVLTWAPHTSLSMAPTAVEESTDGGSTWTPLATVAAGIATWTHVAPSTATAHQYRIRPQIGGRDATWALSTVVQLLAPPLAPTELAPDGPTVDNMDDATTLAWRPNPTDGTPQESVDVRYRVDAGAWVGGGPSPGTEPFSIVPAETWAHGVTVEWQVRTKHAHATWSPWSTIATFPTGARPTATIQTPQAVHGRTTLTVAWAYFDMESTAQAEALVELLDDAGRVLFTRRVLGPATVQAVPLVLDNHTSYLARVTVQDGSGLWSRPAELAFTTDFVAPTAPEVTAEFDEDTGRMHVSITNPPPPTNLLPNHSFDTNTTSWGGNAGTIARDTTTSLPGSDGACLRLTPTGANTYAAVVGNTLTSPPPIPGETYTAGASVWSMPGTSPRGVRLTLRFTTADGASVGEVSSPDMPDTMAGQRLTVSGMAPVGAEGMRIVLWHSNLTGPMPTNVHSYWDHVTLEVGATDGAWIDPDATIPADHNELWRSLDAGPFELVAANLPVDAAVTDHTPLTHGTTTYRALAVSETPTATWSADTPITTRSPWLYVTGGPGNATIARGKGGAAVTAAVDRTKVLHRFAGRHAPVEFLGETRTRVYALACNVDGHGLTDLGAWQAWEAIADLPAPLLYRDPMGRYVHVSISDVAISHAAPSKYAAITATLTEVATL